MIRQEVLAYLKFKRVPRSVDDEGRSLYKITIKRPEMTKPEIRMVRGNSLQEVKSIAAWYAFNKPRHV